MPGQKSVTLRQIAFIAGVGVSTASRALQDAGDISETTKARIRSIADAFGYRRNNAAVKLKTGKAFTVAFLVYDDEQTGRDAGDLVLGASHALVRSRYSLILRSIPRDRALETLKKLVASQLADAFILSDIEPFDERVAFLHRQGIPFITHGRTCFGFDHPYHDYDNARFGLLAVRRLGALGRGRLAIVAPPPKQTYFDHMLSGFLSGITRCGLDHVVPTLTVEMSHCDLQAQTVQLLTSDQEPDGFVVANAISAIAVANACAEVGHIVGKTVDIVAKTATPLGALSSPSIHWCEEDFADAGRHLAKGLLNMLTTDTGDILQTIVPPAGSLADPLEVDARLGMGRKWFATADQGP